MTFGSRAHSARARWRGKLAAAIVAPAIFGMGLSDIALAQPAQPEPAATARPRSARRLVRLFDFEEPDNPNPVPDHWFHAQDEPDGARRPGFPQGNMAVFDFTMSSSGRASVRLPTMGGSTSLRLEPGEIPIFPGADYSVSTKVRTADLEFARAFLAARFLDQRLKPIPGSEVRSRPVLAPGPWQTVRVVVAGNWPDAAWLQIDLELLQPAIFEPKPPEAIAMHFVRHEDVSGAAYFDDVAVALVPRTRFWTEQPSGLFVAPEMPALAMLARDQGGEDLHARVNVYDMDNHVLAGESFKLDPSARATTWAPNLPGYGWFRAVMEIDAADVSVTRQELWLCSLPERAKLAGSAARAADLLRFGIIADSTPEDVLAQIPAIAERARTRFIVLPAFDASVPAQGARAALAARGAIIEKLLARGQQITLALGHAPPALAASMVLDPTDALGLCEQDPKLWSPWLEPTLDVYGQRVARYQLGSVFDTHALRRDPSTGLEAFERVVARLVPGPRIALPWRADHPLPIIARSAGGTKPGTRGSGAPLLSGLSVVFPLGFAPRAMGELASAWRGQVAPGDPMELTVVPELPDLDRFGARAVAVEAARRIAEFWNALGGGSGEPETPGTPRTPLARVAVDAPWRIAEHAGERTLLPGPELAVMTQMAEQLAGRCVIATVPAPAGVRALLLAEHAGAGGANQADDGSGRPGNALTRACVIAWNESAAPERSWVDVYPSRDGVDVADIFGNTAPLSAAAGGTQTPGAPVQVRVRLTDAPVFIEGVDPYLAQFTSSFRLTPRFIPAIAADHEVRIALTNPWPIRITGQVQLKESETGPTLGLRSAPWTISPNVAEFAVAPGQTITLPVTVSFGPGQLAGTKDLVIVARVLADKQYPAIRSNASVEVGLPDLELVPEVRLGPTPTGPDVIVVAGVTNRGSRPRTLRVEISDGFTPSQQLPISDLPPSETIFKRFVIRDGAKLLAGKHVRVTLGDDESAARLSKAALVPDSR